MGIWGVYSDRHGGIDLAGDRASVRGLAAALADWSRRTLVLDPPPPSWLADDTAALSEIRCVPSDDPAGLIVLRRERAALVIEGGSEVGRIFGGGISRLAEGPYRTSGVRTHIHLNPTTDPEHTIYSPESTVEVSVALSDEQA